MQIELIIIFWCMIMFITSIHELGHLVIARLLGVKVDSFSLGFGPALLTYQDKKKTNWCFKLIPLGGSIQIADDGNETDAMLSIPPVKNALISLGGPLVNILFFLFGGTLFYHHYGFYSNKYTYLNNTYYVSPSKNEQKKRFILHKDANKKYHIHYTDLKIKIIENKKKEKYVMYQIGQVEHIFSKMFHNKKYKHYHLSFYNSFCLCLNYTKNIISKIIHIFTHWQELKNLKSILTTQKIIVKSLENKTYEEKIKHIIFLLLIISLQLGLFNLLPIFGFDGFWILFSILSIFFKPKGDTQRRLIIILNYGTYIMFSLFFFIFFRDIYDIIYEYFYY
jgi:regulator of sigma E protease